MLSDKMSFFIFSVACNVEFGLFYFRHQLVLIAVKQRVRGIAVSAQIDGLNANEFW